MKNIRSITPVFILFFVSITSLYSQQSVVFEYAKNASIFDWDSRSFFQDVNLSESPDMLAITVDLKHEWVNDLEMIVTNPDGQTAVIFSQLGNGDCFGCDGDNMNIIFNDTSPNSYLSLKDSCGNNPAYAGDAQAMESLDALLTGTVNGTWYIEIKDFWPGEKGIINNITMVFDALSAPLCTSLNDPQNGSTGVAINSELKWAPATDASGYQITVGTKYGSTDILDKLDVGNVTSYKTDDFPCDTSIFVSVIPYNSTGEATECGQDSFFTESVTAIAGEDVDVCPGDSVQITASGATIYSWSPSDKLNDPNISEPVVSPELTTIYTVTVTNERGCYDVDSLVVTVFDEILITIDTINHVRVGRPGFIEISSNDSMGTYIYNWTGPNDFSSQDEDIAELEIGCYTLIVSDSLTGCIMDTTICVDDLTRTMNMDLTKNVKVYPNPASDIINIDFTNSMIEDADICLQHISGKLLRSIQKKKSETLVRLHSKDLDTGLYLLTIQSRENNISKIVFLQ